MREREGGFGFGDDGVGKLRRNSVVSTANFSER